MPVMLLRLDQPAEDMRHPHGGLAGLHPWPESLQPSVGDSGPHLHVHLPGVRQQGLQAARGEGLPLPVHQQRRLQRGHVLLPQWRDGVLPVLQERW